MPEVHRIDTSVDPNVKPAKHILTSPNLATKPNLQNKPRLGQGRVDLSRNMKASIHVQPQIQPREISQIKEQTLSKEKGRYLNTFN